MAMKVLLGLATFFTGTPGLFFAWLAIEASRYPYSENGRYFDGMVVHHQDSVLGYGLLAAVFLFSALIGLYFLLKRIARDRKN
jgi:hypothetical protein